jgi:hypothetical protein
MRDGLLEKGIDESDMLGPYEFGLLAEGEDRERIAERCLGVKEESEWVLEKTMMRGVGKEAVRRRSSGF